MTQPGGDPFAVFLLLWSVLFVCFGSVYVVAAAGVWRARNWGRWLGIVIAAIAVGAVLVLDGQDGIFSWMLWGINGVVIVCLWRWRRPTDPYPPRISGW